MKKTFVFKLYKSNKNNNLHDVINIAGMIYNHCIVLHRKYYQLTGKYLGQSKLKHHLAKLKQKSVYKHWNLVGSQAIQNIVERLDLSYKQFFKSIKNKSDRKVSPPHFRKIIKYKSITLKQTGYKFLDINKIKVHKQTYRYFKSRDIEGDIKTLTIKRDTLGDVYIYAMCELLDVSPNRIMTGKSAGFDFGLHTFITTSDGLTINSPLYYKQSLRELQQASKCLSSKQKGSNNRYKAKLDLARSHKKISNQRKDFIFKITRQLAQEYDYIFLEDLSMQGMTKLWGRKINDLAWHQFIQVLMYFSNIHGCKVITINRFFPSSKTCHICNYIKEDLTLSDRMWQCPNCNVTHDRDINAAKNIHIVGASTIGLGDVGPSMMAISV